MRIAAVLLGALLSLAAGAPAAAGSLDWSAAPINGAAIRTIEIEDAIPGSRWDVKAATRWLGKRTASRLKVVAKCSRVVRCVRVQDGEVQGLIGRSRGTVVTIDTARAARDYGRYYGKDAGAARNRTWLIVHELGHQFGLRHSGGRNVMNPAVNRYRMQLTAGQRAHLRRV